MATKLWSVKTLLHITQPKKIPSDIWSCADGDLKIKLTRKRSSQHQDGLLPPKMSSEECLFPFLLFCLTIFFLILTPWRSIWFFCPLRALPCPRKIVLDLLRCWWPYRSSCLPKTSLWFLIPHSSETSSLLKHLWESGDSYMEYMKKPLKKMTPSGVPGWPSR